MNIAYIIPAFLFYLMFSFDLYCAYIDGLWL